MVWMAIGEFASIAERARHLVPVVISLTLAVLLIAAVASTYFGRSRSPYDTCYEPNGRAVSCSVLEALR